MPITPSYSWQESPTWVTIHVALRSVSLSNIDIITTDCYIKVNCSPYLFQVDLFEDIESNKSSAVVDNGVVRFFLVKKQHSLWGRLHAVGEKKGIISKRERSLEESRERSNKLKADAKVKTAQLERLSVQSQMKLDEEKRKLVEERKSKELKLERDRIQSWQTNLEDRADINCTRDSISKGIEDANNASSINNSLTADFAHFEASDDCFDLNHSQDKPQEIKQYPKAPEVTNTILPAPRQSVSICVKFTPKSLSLNLPARESRDKLRLKEKKATNVDTIDVSEREPLFLQDKGDEFYMRNDFSSAVNAYTEALQKDPTLLLSLANRAACFLKLNQFQKCIDDCSKSLILIEEENINIPWESETTSEASNIDRVCEGARSEACPNSGLESVAEESLNILQDFIHSKEGDKKRWVGSARKKILVRRCMAWCKLKQFDKAKEDFSEASVSNIPVEDLMKTLGITE
ncbi:hypothetical protein KP509_21G053700 [Ceratopteris richardii]|uniref:CS domain-containing protein n=1 Tax=Ceratopteris richardii TaxID=49495 RepID=A0A8T2SCY7_CERRI|nr:hypothetical protein KP509_21G053700 [Ceratopteris richardii]